MDCKPPFISGFIELYRAHPALWKIKDENYANKRLRDEAYDMLLQYYKKTVPSATVDMVKRKINNLRCSFRKELKKVRSHKSGSSGENAYTPSLWYFDSLMFTADQEETRSTVESLDETSNPAQYTSPQVLSPSSPVSSWSDIASPGPSSISRETDKLSHSKRRKMVVDAALKALKEDDEFDGIGLNVACKLRRMAEEQKEYAEILINKVLMNGLKGWLQEETDLCDLKFIQPQRPVHSERATSYSFQTTTGDTSRECFLTTDVENENRLTEFLMLK